MKKCNWNFDKIEPESRRKRLGQARSSEEIIETIAKSFIQSLSQNLVQFGWEQSEKQNDDFRLVIQFLVDPALYDFFFNGCTGYRAHFWNGAHIGMNFNKSIILKIRKSLHTVLSYPLRIDKLSRNYTQIGNVDLDKETLENSLDSDLAKIWYCTLLLRPGQEPQSLFPFGISGAKIGVASEDNGLRFIKKQTYGLK